MDIQTQSVLLSKSPETEGFDLEAGQSWIYPTNYSTREYQYNIVQQALLKNTLVSLPTGLGKTFIAAVVMYNFYRWYPQGKIIFMAPTKPLVKQQVEACYNIMAIPHEVTTELTGAKVSSSRSNIWLEKRIFFITPQILQNDLEKVAELGSKIKCLVFDEAHRARGNHAYCQVIRKLLANNHKYFRVLALSATPGSRVNDVSEVIQNLLISHLEFRTEESLDVKPYVFERSLETIVVPLGNKLIEIKEEYLKILEQYARTLKQHKVIQGNCESLTKGRIFMLMKDFQAKRGASSSHYGEIMKCLNICITLYHAYDLLIRHGLRNFLSFFDEHIEKPLLRGNMMLRSILEKVRDYLGPIPTIEVLPDGTYPEVPKSIKFGHPKHYKLRDVLISHFSMEDKQNSRVIVFFEYRESVMEAHTLLLQSRPLVQPKIFLGQKSGITQKTQLGVVKAFREGKCNTLLSTCIGEEGLDVGEVDLIVCFDISSKSPIRMVQRMGRTGRKREGSVFILVTEGKEQQTLKDCLIHKNNISTHVLGSAQIKKDLFLFSPRLVPEEIKPKCEKLFITVTKKPKKKDIKDLLRSSSSSGLVFSQNNEIMNFKDKIPELKMLSLSENPSVVNFDNSLYGKYIEIMRTANKTCLVGHSDSTNILNDLLCYADSKRFNIPTKIQGNTNGLNGKSLKQGDIRNMFFKGSQCIQAANVEGLDMFRTPSIEDLTIEQNYKTTDLALDEMFNLISNYLVSDLKNDLTKCRFCKDFNCQEFVIDSDRLCSKNNNNNNNNFIPSEDILNNITLENIEDYIATLDGSYYLKQNIQMEDFKDCSNFEDEFNDSKEKQYSFVAPSNYLKLMETIQDYTQEDYEENTNKFILEFFKLESIADFFCGGVSADSSQDTIIYTSDNEVDKQQNSVKSFNELLRDLDDFCDLSSFGLANTEKIHKNTKKIIEDLSDFCDISLFNLKSCQITEPNQDISKITTQHKIIPDKCNQMQITITQMLKCVNGDEKHENKISSQIFNNEVKCVSDKNGSIEEQDEDIINLTNKEKHAETKLSLVSDDNQINSDNKKHEKNIYSDEIVSLTDDEDYLPTLSLCNKNLDISEDELNELDKNITKQIKLNVLSDSDDDKHNKTSSTNNKFEKTLQEAHSSDEFIPINQYQKLKSDLNINKDEKRDKILQEIKSQKSFERTSSDEFETVRENVSNGEKWLKKAMSPTVKHLKEKKKNVTRVRLQPKKTHNNFIELEAEVSDNENVSEDEDETFLDSYEKSFVHDETQSFHNTEMHGVYLRSIMSPSCRKNLQCPKQYVNIANVYSQAPAMEENTYLEDSFCVDTDEENGTQIHELSELDILEQKLEEKKRKKSSTSSSGTSKRRRIKILSSDSD